MLAVIGNVAFSSDVDYVSLEATSLNKIQFPHATHVENNYNTRPTLIRVCSFKQTSLYDLISTPFPNAIFILIDAYTLIEAYAR